MSDGLSFLTRSHRNDQPYDQVTLDESDMRVRPDDITLEDYAPKRRRRQMARTSDSAVTLADELERQIGDEAERAVRLHRINQAQFDNSRLSELKHQMRSLTYGEMMELTNGVMALIADRQDRQVADSNTLAALLHRWSDEPTRERT